MIKTGRSGRKYEIVIDPPVPPETVGSYRVLGEGSFGRVLLGKDEDGKYVAIKEVRGYGRRKDQLDREIGIGRHLGCDHKNIACFMDIAVVGASAILVITEYINGTDMENLKTRFQDDMLGYLDIAQQLVDGLKFMHEKDVAHRDIKPANIILRGHTPIYIDFDMSCIRGSEKIPCKGFTGTPYYLSPENWKIDKSIDHFLSDIYSLGVTFYYIFNNGKLPFIGSELRELKRNVLYKKPIPSDTGIPELDDLIMKMISKNSLERPSLQQINSELSELIKSTYGDPIQLPQRDENTDDEFDSNELDKIDPNKLFD